MKRITKILTVLAGVLFLASGVAYAADATATIGASVNGSPICTLSISSSDLDITAPTAAGLSTTAFTNSPITMELTDNDLDAVTGDILSVAISSSVPDQYGTTGAGITYYISLGAAAFSAEPDSEITAGEVSSSAITLTDSSAAALSFGTASGKILHGVVTQAANLVVNADKRVYGDTSDSITIEYTLTDK